MDLDGNKVIVVGFEGLQNLISVPLVVGTC